MRRTVTIFALLLLALSVFSSYALENEIEDMRARLAGLDGEFLQEQRNVQVLKAEWSFLNQPERLQAMATRHVDRVGLQPVSPAQIGHLAELPMRPPPAVDDNANDGWDAVAGLPRPSFKPSMPDGVVLTSSGSLR